MKRADLMRIARQQESDASCINNARGMARKGKRLGSKRVRRYLKKLDVQQVHINKKVVL